jgi:putative DNA-invertase from lambdoid prophage Rac
VKCAVWMRVSTDEQDSGNQSPEIEGLVTHRGYQEVIRYQFTDSAFKEGPEYKRNRQQLLKDAQAGKFSVLVVWAADRLSRQGIEDLLMLVRQLAERGVTVVSVQEPWLNGDASTVQLLLAISAWIAEQESVRRSERIKAGIAKRKAAGLHTGRKAGSRDVKPRRTEGYKKRYE